MPIVRKLIAQDENDVNQWLKVDHSTRYIVNDSPEWQFLFGPNSSLSNSALEIKIAARYDDNTFNNIKVVAYLYETQNAAVGNAASCQFKIFKVNLPDWTETLEDTLTGTQLSNNYFYINPTLSSLSNVNFDGGDTIMIEATITRLGITYRDRLYVNHLGIYDNVTRLRQDVEFLDATKLDE
jgi:hypothetical protein